MQEFRMKKGKRFQGWTRSEEGMRSRYVRECREMAAELGSWAARNIDTGGQAYQHAKVAARNAFVVLGLRYNCAADHEVDVSC